MVVFHLHACPPPQIHPNGDFFHTYSSIFGLRPKKKIDRIVTFAADSQIFFSYIGNVQKITLYSSCKGKNVKHLQFVQTENSRAKKVEFENENR